MLLSLPTSSHAVSWQKQQSEHFTIIYNAKQRQLATYYLSTAEKVYSELIPVFKEAPDNTYLVLTDYFDFSNGAATVFPHPTIYLYPSLPDTNDSIENHSSWAYMLLKHEYTHILNMHPVHGVPGFFSWIFGAWVRPNMFLPHWYLEGLAVERESDGNNRFGRLNSPYYQGLLRANVLENTLKKETIDRYSSFDVPLYPYGSRPYFLGSFYWQYLTRTYGTEIIHDLNQDYSKRIPWLIESPLINKTDLTYNDNLKDAYDFYIAKTNSEVSKLNAPTHNTTSKLSGYFQRNFSFHPFRKEALYITKGRTGKDDIRKIIFTDKKNALDTITKDTSLVTADKIVRATWSPDGKSILYDKIHTYQGKYQYLDLYSRPLNSNTSKAITKGKRARDAIYLTSNEIIYVKSDGLLHLQKLNTDTNTVTNLFNAKLEEKILNPVVLNNDIYFVLKRPSGMHQVLKLAGQIEVIYQSYFPIYDLSVCKNQLCWIDEASGVANFVSFDLTKKILTPLTNSRTAITAGTLTADTLIYSEINSKGSYFVQTHEATNTKLSVIRGPTAFTEWEVDLLQPKEEAYYSTAHLYPRYWLPFIAGDENGTYTSIQTSASDPALLQNYAILLGYYSANDKWDKNFAYQNVYWDISLNLNAYETYEYLESIDDSIKRQRLRFGLTTSIYPISEDLFFNAFISSEKAGLDGASQRKAEGAGVFLTYDQTDSVPHGGVLPETGYIASLGYSKYFKKNGYFDFKITEAYFAQYLNYFLPDNHVVHYRLAARRSDSNGRPLSLGSLTIGGQEITNDNYTFAIRGYPSGNFLAWSAYLGQINYSFPLKDIYRGSGTLPIFIKNIYANIVAETLAIDGAYYNENQILTATDEDELFSAYGLELKANAEIFYSFPITWVLGYYFGTSERAGGEDRVYFRVEATGF